jgi:glycerol kinase
VGSGILAVDQGTSATKAIVVDGDGVVRAVVEVPVTLRTTSDGGVEQDPSELLASVLDAGRRALAEARVDVVAVGVANQGETVLAWDARTGEARSAAISWQDRRSASVVEALEGHGPRLREITGLPLDPYFTAPKLTWLSDVAPRDAIVTSLDAWITWHLCGRIVTDAATASRSLVFDLNERTWSREAAAIFGLDVAALPQIVGNSELVAETTAFGPTLALSSLIVDQQAALWGEGCRERGTAKCTYGTGAFFLLNCGERPTRSDHGLSASLAWAAPDDLAYCLDGQVYSAGSAVDWLIRMGLLTSSAMLDDVAATVRDSSRVTCVPAFAGLGAPRWEPRASAHFDGIDLSTSPADIVWSVLDGIACQVAAVVAAAESDLATPLDVVRVDGGLTRSRVLMQHQADVLQRPVEVFVSPHATALGVADLARRGAGLPEPPPAARADREPVVGDRFVPRISATDARGWRERWDAAADRAAAAVRRP